MRKYVPHTGRRYTGLQYPVASCGKPVPVDRGSSKVLLSQRRRAAAAMRSKPDRDCHSVDSSRRRHGPPTDSRREASDRSAASSPSRRPPNIRYTEKIKHLHMTSVLPGLTLSPKCVSSI